MKILLVTLISGLFLGSAYANDSKVFHGSNCKPSSPGAEYSYSYGGLFNRGSKDLNIICPIPVDKISHKTYDLRLNFRNEPHKVTTINCTVFSIKGSDGHYSKLKPHRFSIAGNSFLVVMQGLGHSTGIDSSKVMDCTLPKNVGLISYSVDEIF